MTIDKDTPDRIYATSGQEWSPFAGEPAVEYIKASKVNALVQELERSKKRILYLGTICRDERHDRANHTTFIPLINNALNEYKGTK